jgi:maleylpyruvate isomerase
VSVPQIELDGCRQAHAKLVGAIADLTDDDVGQPSLLPGWTVGHVLARLARNADAMCRRIDAAMQGEIVEQYIGGANGRATEIDAGATRAAEVIVADVTSSTARLEALFASIPVEHWSTLVRTVRGDERPLSMLPFRRWREVEIHMVDLGMGASPPDWPTGLVELALPRLTASLAERCDPHVLMAWALGRGPAPELEPWG